MNTEAVKAIARYAVALALVVTGMIGLSRGIKSSGWCVAVGLLMAI